jgi:hypothetical protein
MEISDERLDEIMQEMLDNTDEDGWCTTPENLTDEEQEELHKRLAIATMKERIVEVKESLFNVFGFIADIEEHFDQYEFMDLIKIKSAMEVNKEDATNMLMDLHSTNKAEEFFSIQTFDDGSENGREEAERSKAILNDIIETQFKEEVDDLKLFCEKLIQNADKLLARINNK